MRVSLLPSLPALAAGLSLITGLCAQDPAQDPSKAEVSLPASRGWNASLVYAGDAGVWTTRSFPLLTAFGCPEVVACDDKGRLITLVSYSGKWTPNVCQPDRQWLGPIERIDLDPAVPGPELYVGGESGDLHQVVHTQNGNEVTMRHREVAHVADDEIHTLVKGEFRTDRQRQQLLVFTRKGKVFELRHDGTAMRFTQVGIVEGRVRDAVSLPGDRTSVLTASRAGVVQRVTVRDGRLTREDVLREPMGFGRIALAPTSQGKGVVAYVTRDDGVILRLGQTAAGWNREVVFAGPQGPRGLVAGRFDRDPNAETLAVFGYSKTVHLLTRYGRGPWRAEEIFVDEDKGHWLGVAEVDGRNDTQEIVGSGYSGNVFLLSREPGYGLVGGVATKPQSADDDQQHQASGWTVDIALTAGEKLSGCAVGELRDDGKGLELVAVSRSGKVFLVSRKGNGWSAEPIFDAPGELIQCAVGDLDANARGNEIAVVGMAEGDEDEGKPGAAWVLTNVDGRWRADQVVESEKLIHGLAIHDGALFTVGFDRRLRRTRRSGSEWETATASEALPSSGKAVTFSWQNKRLSIACVGGEVVEADTQPRIRGTRYKRFFGRARLDGRFNSLLIADDDGSLCIGAKVIYKEPSKLRGAVFAEIDPDSSGMETACAGYEKKITVLRKTKAGWKPEVVHTDTDRFHHLTSGDLDGDGVHELVAAGFAGNLLVVRRNSR